MASNVITMSCNKHVNIRYKYVNEYMEDGVVKFIFIMIFENDDSQQKLKC